MTPDECKTAAISIYGKRHWIARLAADTGKDPATIFRWFTDKPKSKNKNGPPKYLAKFLDVKMRERKMNAMAKKLAKL